MYIHIWKSTVRRPTVAVPQRTARRVFERWLTLHSISILQHLQLPLYSDGVNTSRLIQYLSSYLIWNALSFLGCRRAVSSSLLSSIFFFNLQKLEKNTVIKLLSKQTYLNISFSDTGAQFVKEFRLLFHCP